MRYKRKNKSLKLLLLDFSMNVIQSVKQWGSRSSVLARWAADQQVEQSSILVGGDERVRCPPPSIVLAESRPSFIIFYFIYNPTLS